uniref:Plant heme peroxidase family profile domain-containing protein n=1 Tax=Physcomitrium patens TaxID=3218 RepID=A0A2K1IHY8_PHYPA|nr:hypothetical protein PHYPA_027585 [Physcomitrium patens]
MYFLKNYLSKLRVYLNILVDLVKKIKKKCHSSKLQKCNFNLDTNTNQRFDSKYYNYLLSKRSILILDQILFLTIIRAKYTKFGDL